MSEKIIGPRIHPIVQTSLPLEDVLPSFKVKDPISCLTHFIGFLAAILGMPVLLLHASACQAQNLTQISLAIFMLSMICLYGASSAYHAFNLGARANRILKKLDHMMIFVLIAGSYTPVCLAVLSRNTGLRLFVIVWAIAIAGILFKAFWVTCPKWVSSVLYIGMGWVCLLAFQEIYAVLPTSAFLWLLAGGLFYTVGGVIYALKLSILGRHFKSFGAHELFHLFVMAGSLCHYWMMYSYVANI
jgi:hemolysin III